MAKHQKFTFAIEMYKSSIPTGQVKFASGHDPQGGRGNNVDTIVVRPAEPSLRWTLSFYAEFRMMSQP